MRSVLGNLTHEELMDVLDDETRSIVIHEIKLIPITHNLTNEAGVAMIVVDDLGEFTAVTIPGDIIDKGLAEGIVNAYDEAIDRSKETETIQ